MERLRRLADDHVQAEYNGDWYDARLVHETIKVKGAAPVVEEVIITRHGPIINHLAPDFTGEQPLALRWTALEPNTMIQGQFEMLQARDVHAFHHALRHWAVPIQNVVYADLDGNIAYTFPGKVPLRAKGNGKVPVPGWNDEYEWTGYIPYDALPHLVNPPQGYIATANNRAVSDDYPIRLDLEPISGDRAQRIHEMILMVNSAPAQCDIPFINRCISTSFSTPPLIARAVKHSLTHQPIWRSNPTTPAR
jgi:penicillin amidase